MPKFYFTYGSDERFPFQNGWTEVHAENMRQAETLFRAVHPDRAPGTLNCSWVYDEKKFEKTDCFKKGNFGARCHEVIGCFASSDAILDVHKKLIKELGHCLEMPMIAFGQYFGAIDYAQILGFISEYEADKRKAEIMCEYLKDTNKKATAKEDVKKICCFCGKPLPTIASQNNAKPVKDGVCCLKCNITIVAPARARLTKEGYLYD